MIRNVIVGSIFIYCHFIGFSQSTQMSESDVQVQSIFIEAIRNKLIDRHDLSVTQFKEIIEKQPDNHVAWYELAFALDKTKNMTKHSMRSPKHCPICPILPIIFS